MTGPEHYRNGEQHMRHASQNPDDEASAWHQRQAIAHFLAALTAATALRDGGDDMYVEDKVAWVEAASMGASIEDQDGEPEPGDYDPGPECDDEGGMSEYRNAPDSLMNAAEAQFGAHVMGCSS